MPTLKDLHNQLQTRVRQSQGETFSRERFESWKNLPLTQQFFLELEDMYFDALVQEPVTVAHSQMMGQSSTGESIIFNHTNPMEETAINAALKAGRIQVIEALMDYVPTNLERENNSEL